MRQNYKMFNNLYNKYPRSFGNQTAPPQLTRTSVTSNTWEKQLKFEVIFSYRHIIIVIFVITA